MEWNKEKNISLEAARLSFENQTVEISSIAEGIMVSLQKEGEPAEEQFIISQPVGTIYVRPQLPDRPLLLKGLPKLKILPGESCELKVLIPATIQLFNSVSQQTNLWEQPLSVLSQAWIGEPDNGILGYSLFDCCHLLSQVAEKKPNDIECRISLTNNSKKTMEPSKLSIDVTRLAVYQKNGDLYTDDIILQYTENDMPIGIEIRQLTDGATLLNNPRNNTPVSIYEKGFNFIKSISQVR